MAAMLTELTPLFIDCQSTGASPATSHLLEIAWNERTFVIQQTAEVPKRILKLVGITSSEINEGIPYLDAWQVLSADVQTLNSTFAVAHFARFEQTYLDRMWMDHSEHKFPLPIFCTHRIAKLLFPDLPSHGLRAVAGWFHKPLDDGKRAANHVEATRLIWECMIEELRTRGIYSLEDLTAFVEQKPGKSPTRKQYLISKEKRLALPNKPGIYRFIDRSGNVLYVGKATSLKHRVNSYFTGGVKRDHRKLEMLAQSVDLQVEPLDTPLEAGMREFEEIRRLAPRYNVVMKAKEKSSSAICPFLPRWFVEQFYGLDDNELLESGYQLWLDRQGLDPNAKLLEHDLLNLGLPGFRVWLAEETIRHQEKLAGILPEEDPTKADQADNEETEAEEEFTWTPEIIADHIPTVLRRGLREHIRTKWLKRLHHATVSYRTKQCKVDRMIAPSPDIFNPKDSVYARVLLHELRRVETRGGSWSVVEPLRMLVPFWI